MEVLKMKGSTIRKIGLIAFLIAYGIATLAAFMMGQFQFGISLVLMGLCIGAGEIISVATTGNTLSTNITRAWKEGGMKAVWGWVMCVSLVFTMIFLGVHFIPWEKFLGQI